jgi:DNA polymerase III epsilon subunit-like protein
MAMIDPDEVYICVDVETAGPIPPDYSLLSIGACTVIEPQSTFYIELQPVNAQSVPEAVEVHKLSLERLTVEGVQPRDAMQRFETWLKELSAPPKPPVFVAFNAPFDWMFINYYFMHYLGYNPFGHGALDIKAFYMGQAGVPWHKTSWRYLSPQYAESTQLTHHALQDALDQAGLFKKLLEDTRS